MAQKEDILEQIVEEYLTHQGYFVRHNIKYRPADFRQTPSDIDVLAVDPRRSGAALHVGFGVPSETAVL